MPIVQTAARLKMDKHSNLEKMPTGIEGLDEITHGGLPRHRTTLIMGGPGAGKTVLAMQILVNGARQFGEPSIIVAFEESRTQLIANAATFGWNIPALEKKKLFFLDARLDPEVVKAGQFDLTGLLATLKVKADEMGAKRIVFDAIDVLLTMLNDHQAERQELFRLQNWLLKSGLTGIITSKVDSTDASLDHQYGFMKFMVDCAIVLQHRITEHVSMRNLRVMKYRGSAFAENEAPMVIGAAGIEVASFSSTELTQATTERVSTGVARLDAMLGGGYYRGASVLITGASGTAKSTLSGAFIEAACRRKERALYVSFDEDKAEIVRNLTSVGIHMAPYLKSGLLKTFSASTEANNANYHLMKIKHLIQEYHPRCLVIDPLSALIGARGSNITQGIAKRLLQFTKAEGITVVFTSLLQSADSMSESTPVQASTVADTWIHLSYAVQEGERNRALTIVMSRGMQHSNQMRELVLSKEGVTLADVYAIDGEVLMGTLRWQKEQAVKAEKSRIQIEVTRKRHEIELAQAELNARMEVLRQEVEIKKVELELLLEEERRSAGVTARHNVTLLHKRGGDKQMRAPSSQGKSHRSQRASK